MHQMKKPVITIALVVINVLAFVWLSFFGMTEDGGYMLQHGAMYLPLVIEKGEYYRLITCIFLHFGFQHNFSAPVLFSHKTQLRKNDAPPVLAAASA